VREPQLIQPFIFVSVSNFSASSAAACHDLLAQVTSSDLAYSMKQIVGIGHDRDEAARLAELPEPDRLLEPDAIKPVRFDR